MEINWTRWARFKLLQELHRWWYDSLQRRTEEQAQAMNEEIVCNYARDNSIPQGVNATIMFEHLFYV